MLSFEKKRQKRLAGKIEDVCWNVNDEKDCLSFSLLVILWNLLIVFYATQGMYEHCLNFCTLIHRTGRPKIMANFKS